METLFLIAAFISVVVFLLTPWSKSGFVAAVASLVGYFYLSGIYNWTPVILFVLGLVLIMLEVFIPDFGLLGLLGTGSVALGVYYTTGDFGIMVRDLSLAIMVSAILIVVLVRKGYSISNFNKMVLRNSSKQSNDQEVDDIEKQPLIKVGMIGEAQTPLRPSGKVRFNGQTPVYDVLSSGEHISPGTKVVVHEVHRTKIVVREQK